jgi:hypothetical protein
MSHGQKGDVTHTRVMSIKMVCLVLGIEKYSRTDRINVAVDVHVEVSRGRGFGMIVENHTVCTGMTEKIQI